jgi:hypothetical protein
VSVPPGTGVFDVHVSTLPFDTVYAPTNVNGINGTLRKTRRYGDVLNVDLPDDVPDGSLGPITVVITQPNAKAWPDAAGNVTQVLYTGIGPTHPVSDGGVPTPKHIASNHYTDGSHRIIGLAFEVVNTTPALYRGGSVTCWRQTADPVGNYMNAVDALGDPAADYHDMVFSRAPPPTVDDAMLLRDTVQWPAEQGAYVVSSQTGWDNEFVIPQSKYQIIDGAGAQACYDSRGNTFTGITNYAVGNADWSTVDCPMNNSNTEFSNCGAIFSGLQEQTTLRINWRFIVERTPSLSEPDLVVLTSPSPAYDPVAYEFYSHARRLMPVGVPLNENFMGTWFKEAAKNTFDAVKGAAKFAAPRLLKGQHPLEIIIEGATKAHRGAKKKQPPAKKKPMAPKRKARKN